MSASPQKPIYDAIVLGAGISGLTAGHALNEDGCSVRILDNYTAAGGNHISEEIDGMSFDIGAIFHWGNSDLFNIFPSLRVECIPIEWRTDKINPAGSVVSYPYDVRKELFSGSVFDGIKVISSIAKHRCLTDKKENAHSFLTHYLGRELLDSSGVEHYVQRLYGISSKDIHYDFAVARMRHIVQRASVKHYLSKVLKRKRHKTKVAERQCLARPKSGFARFYGKAAKELMAKGVAVTLDADLIRISNKTGLFLIETASENILARRVVSTIPMTEMGRLSGVDISSAPISIPLHTLYWKYKGELGFKGPILYNFQKKGQWKRLTLHSQYYGKVNDWSYFSTETTCPDERYLSADICELDFIESIRDTAILKGNLRPVGHRLTEFAYPLYDKSAFDKRVLLMEKLDALGIEYVGRQGAFEYLPISQAAINKVYAHITSKAAG